VSCPACLDWRHAERLPGGIVAHLGNSERWRMGAFLKTRLVSSTNSLRDGALRAGAEVWNERHAPPTDYDRPTNLDAAAVVRCCKCVLANPGYHPLAQASISGIPQWYPWLPEPLLGWSRPAGATEGTGTDRWHPRGGFSPIPGIHNVGAGDHGQPSHNSHDPGARVQPPQAFLDASHHRPLGSQAPQTRHHRQRPAGTGLPKSSRG
jgi:hypothetical protein